jgi:hypothetical protein
LVLILSAAAACRRPHDAAQVRAVDLLFHFKDAVHRPDPAPFEIREHTAGGRARPSLVVPPVSRVIWRVPIPERARLVLHAAVPADTGPATAVFRVGISDGRQYETLAQRSVTSAETAAAWVEMAADLSMYAGRKFSIFYRPDSIRWQLIVGTYVTAGSPPFLVLGTPSIETDSAAARNYNARLVRRPGL